MFNCNCAHLASFPGSPRGRTKNQATESWAGPANKATVHTLVVPEKKAGLDVHTKLPTNVYTICAS